MMDYTTTSYGGQGGAGGKGWLSQSGSQDDGGGKTYGKDTLRPLTIKQILEAKSPHPDGEHRVDDVEITTITFVGNVRTVVKQATNITYRLEDGTGTVDVKQWVDPEAADQMSDDMDGGLSDGKSKIEQNTWVRVWGKLKAFNDKRHVGATIIRPITDFNEIQYHFLEATVVHLFFTRGPPVKNGAGGGGAGHDTNMNMGGNMAMDGGGARQLPPMSPFASKVWHTMKSMPINKEGFHAQQIAAQAGLAIADVYKGGQELISEGMIYETFDDDTWALTATD